MYPKTIQHMYLFFARINWFDKYNVTSCQYRKQKVHVLHISKTIRLMWYTILIINNNLYIWYIWYNFETTDICDTFWQIYTCIFTRCNKKTHVLKLDSSGSSYNFMSNSVWLWQIVWQVALCLCHPYHFWFRPDLSVVPSVELMGPSDPFGSKPRWGKEIRQHGGGWFFIYSHQKAFPAMAKRLLLRFFWVLFWSFLWREGRYIVWVGNKKVPGGGTNHPASLRFSPSSLKKWAMIGNIGGDILHSCMGIIS